MLVLSVRHFHIMKDAFWTSNLRNNFALIVIIVQETTTDCDFKVNISVQNCNLERQQEICYAKESVIGESLFFVIHSFYSGDTHT